LSWRYDAEMGPATKDVGKKISREEGNGKRPKNNKKKGRKIALLSLFWGEGATEKTPKIAKRLKNSIIYLLYQYHV